MVDVAIDPGPKVTLEALYGGAWFDMTCDVTGLRYTRGRTSAGPRAWMTRMPAGEMRVRLDNSAGRYSSFTGNGDLALGEGTLLRLRCEWQGKHHALFVGYVEQWDERWTQVTDEVEIIAVDPLALMSEQGGAFEWVPGRANQTVAARIEQLLGRVGITSQPFYSDEGYIRCIAPKLTSTSVIDEVHRTALSDHGIFFHEPAPITNPADVGATPSQWVYLDRLRYNRIDATQGAHLPPIPVATDTGDWRNVDGPLQRTYEAIVRPAQEQTPVFSDTCVGVEVNLGELEYTNIAWSYIAFERPSLVAVTNRRPPEERDDTGLPLPLPWAEAAAAVGSGDATRHNIISLTDLRFSTDFEAQQLAASVVNQLRQQKLEVSTLTLWPHRDPQQFTTLLGLRLQDHVVTVRNLLHGGVGTRIEMGSMIEGIEVGLVPRPGWAEDSRRAEWTVRFAMSPLLAAVEDIPILPPIIGPPQPNPTYTYVAALTGQRPAGASAAIPVTALAGDTLTLAFDTNQPGNLGSLVFVEAVNVVTLATQRLNQSAPIVVETIAGGRRAAAVKVSTAGLVPGVNYRFRVVEDVAPTFYASNWITVSLPLPTPSTPTIVDVLGSWRYYTYNPGVTATPTTIQWNNISNAVLYQVGIKPDHAANENYETLALQSGSSAVLTLANDTNYSIAVRVASGGAVSPWSAPLKVSMGHPSRIDRSGVILLNDDFAEQSRGRDQMFVGTVRRLITPPPNGGGDGQWTHTPDMFDLDSPNFIGTIIERVRIQAGNVNSAGQYQGPTLRVDAFGIQPRVVVHGQVPFGAYSAIPDNVPNPTWAPPLLTENYVIPMKAGVRDSSPFERDLRFGLLPTGAAYTTNPTGYNSAFDLRLRGGVEIFGVECVPTPRLSNRVVT